eukprot:TRINITY_DN980_c0_g4_i1.p1 TRINITY_DN980_c0_g4~~TRINITY_DN980_c0_g4_i1.p1  ORF type:complete len:515 (+),score=124.53 TRINITY_DN980_c0_g4_i1:64-1545(+)
MPQPVASGYNGPMSMPQAEKKFEDLKPWGLSPGLEKKMKGTTVYGVLIVDKISTKWKRQKRMLMVTSGLLLVCNTDGNVRRVLDLTELQDIIVQPDAQDTFLLFKLGITDENEPDLLVTALIDSKNRSSHDPLSFASVVNVIAKQRNPNLSIVKQLSKTGPHIRSLTRLGHNTVSARDKIKRCTAKDTIRTPMSVPTLAPLSPAASASSYKTAPSDFTSVMSAAKPVEDAQVEFESDADVILASRMRANSAAGQKPEDASEFVKKLRPRAVSFTTPTPATLLSAEPAPSINATAHKMPPVKSLPEDDEGGCGWTEHRDPVSQLTYYHNDKEGRSTWHEPEELSEWKRQKGFLTTTTSTAITAAPLALRTTTLTEDSIVGSDTSEEASSDSSSDCGSSFADFTAQRRPPGGVASIQQLTTLMDGPAVRVTTRAPIQQPAFATHLIESPEREEQLPTRGLVGTRPLSKQSMSVPLATRSVRQDFAPDFERIGLEL